MRSTNLITFTLVLVPFAVAMKADVIAGNPASPDPGTGLCIFGCFFQGEYQQVYTKSLFPGSYEITGLEFFDTIFAPTGKASGSVAISLSTTPADWNTLAHTLSANIGTNQTQVFSGTIGPPWAFPGSLVLPFITPFFYDPSQGNLLVDIQGNIVVGGAVISDTNGFLNPNNFMGVAFTLGLPGRTAVQSGYGLITDFEGAPVLEGSSVPEPSSILLLCSVLGGLVCIIYARLRSKV